ncbi:MAG: hypothetical protein IJW40_10865 [Clostridia bacterium]|nr:hypothetical protein [Clostridia bacterium]
MPSAHKRRPSKSAKNRNRKEISPRLYFCLRKGIAFFGYFLLGILFSHLANTVNTAKWQLLFPSALFADVFSLVYPLPAFGDILSSLLLSTLFRTLPVLLVYWLGLRDYDFYCLSRFWNLVFCAVHGMMLHQFWLIFVRSVPRMQNHALLRFLGIVLFLAFLVSLLYVLRCLLQVNQTAAAGVALPCFGRNAFIFSHAEQDSEPLSARISRYFIDFLLNFSKVYAVGLLMLLLCYAFRRMMNV